MRPRIRAALVALLVMDASASLANAPEASPVPPVRPAIAADSIALASAATVFRQGPTISLRPIARPALQEQHVLFGKRRKRKGSVCGNSDIQGKAVGDVPGRIKACGISEAVQVTSVSGVMLSQPALMDCGTARALNKWVDASVKPVFRQRGPVVELKVVAHYACRTRNNRKGARISEHGKGRAIDVAAFRMKDGESVTVLHGWKKRATRSHLRRVWREACGTFGTVLGPDADRYHRDHFHLDTARHRRGPYCR